MSLDIGNKAEGRAVDVSVKVAGLQLQAFHLLLVTLCLPYPLYCYASSRLGQMMKLSVVSLFKNLNLGFGLPHMPMTTSTGTMDAKEFSKVEQDSKIQMAGDQQEITVLEKDTRIRSDEGAQGPGNITSSENSERIECKVQLNFLGLPIRPGEKECPFYMRTGGCTFAIHCRFHHPDPSAVVDDSFQDLKNGVPSQHHALAEQLCETPMSSESPSNEQTDFLGTFTPNRELQENLHRKGNQKRKLKIRSTAFNLEENKRRISEGGAPANEVRVCKTCNVVCNSAKVFASHLAGEKHALKALGPNYRTMVPKVMAHLKQMKNAEKSVPNKRAGLGYIADPKIVESFSCEVCKIECNSQENFNTHKMGRKHKANLQKLQEKITPKSAATSKENISAGQDQITKVEVLKKSSSTKEDLQTKKEKVVPGGDAEEAIMICALCDVVCNNKVVYDSHISGKKHLAMIKKQEVCKIECNSQETFNTHKMGRKHMTNLQKMQEKITPKSAATSKENISAGQDQITKVKVLKKSSSTKEDLQTKKEKVVPGGAAEESIMICALCDVVCNNKVVYDSHISGKKHLAMIKKEEVCKIECNSQETFNTHKMGRKHMTNLQKMQEKITQSAATSKENISAGQDQITKVEVLKKSSSTKEDLQTKKEKVVPGGAAEEAIMICALCDVVCNSKVVYDSHISGKKHLAMIKKQETQV